LCVFQSRSEGLLPEGRNARGITTYCEKLIKKRLFQLIATGNDLVGAVTVKLMEDE
jgi:serine/threonine-protein kinase HipA